jgi:arginase family enzyme
MEPRKQLDFREIEQSLEELLTSTDRLIEKEVVEVPPKKP